MIDPDHEDLLNREIDGEIADDEAAGLKELIAARPDLQAAREELRSVAEALKSVRPVEAPPALAGDVMRRVREKRRRASRPPAWLEAVRSTLATPTTLRYACVFAAGLVLGLAVALAGRPGLVSKLDGSSLSATVLPDDRLRHLEAIDRRAVSAQGLRGEVETKLAGDLVLTDIRVDSEGPVEVLAEFDPGMLRPVGIERSEGAGGEIALGADRMRLAHPGGNGRYRLVLGVRRPVPSSLRLAFKAGDRTLETSLATRRSGS